MHARRPTPVFQDHPPLSFGDRGLWVVLLITLGFQLIALARTDGYQLADSIEYMDRANMFVRGEEFDPSTPRPFTLSALLVPFFWLARVSDLDRLDGVVALVRGLQMLVGLAAVAVTARIGSRIGGRGLGLASGLLLGSSVPFARYTIEGLADPEAMLLIALGLDALLQPRTGRRGVWVGFCLGFASALSYKAIPVAGALLAAVFLRERLRHSRWLRNTVLTLVLCIAVTAFIDTRIYGDFGSSIGGYVLINAMSVLARVLYRVGLVSAATWVGNTFLLREGAAPVESAEARILQMDPGDYYFADASNDLYPWTLLVLVLLGTVASFRRFSFPATLIAFVVVADVVLLGQKGHKSFRLLLPVLPLVGILGALGWRALRGQATSSLGRRMLASTVLVVGLLAVPGRLFDLELGTHGGYWDAMDIVNADTRRRRSEAEAAGVEFEPVRVASAYHWAVTLRQSSDVDLVRLPLDPLDFSVRSVELRSATLGVLGTLDWFLAHMQVFTSHPALVEAVNERFEIHSILYEGDSYGTLLPIFVFRRRTDEDAGRSLYRWREGVTADELEQLRDGVQNPVQVRFDAGSSGNQSIELIGWDVETGLGRPPTMDSTNGTGASEPGELSWITYHWYAPSDGSQDLVFRDRVTDYDGRATLAGLDGHAPAYGVHPTSQWPRGAVLSESYARVLPAEAGRYGGAHRRGSHIPTMLWMGVAPAGAPAGEGWLSAYDLRDARPLAARDLGEDERGANYRFTGGMRLWDAAGRVAIGGFFLPIPPALRVPDNGRPIGP